MASVFSLIFSLIFPPRCIVCGTETDQINICNPCTQQLPLNRELRNPWLLSLYKYRNPQVNTCIRHIKNHPDTSVIEHMLYEKRHLIIGWTSKIIRQHLCDAIILIPVPMHWSRFLDRGYNQSELIARAYQKIITNNMAVPVTIRPDIIIKSKHTEKQALLTEKSDRLKNIAGAFSIEKGREASLPAHTLCIIIDDVTTTGGTLNEIRNILLPYSSNVVAFTLAH